MLPNLRKLLHVDHIHLIFQTLFLQVSFRNSNILHRSFNFFGKKHSLIGDRLVGCVKQCEYTVTKGNLCENVWNWVITMFLILDLVAKNSLSSMVAEINLPHRHNSSIFIDNINLCKNLANNDDMNHVILRILYLHEWYSRSYLMQICHPSSSNHGSYISSQKTWS